VVSTIHFVIFPGMMILNAFPNLFWGVEPTNENSIATPPKDAEKRRSG
jgi:hypothetical protein